MSVSYKPEGYHTATPYLIVDGADAALAFYRDAFGAEELFRLPMDGKVGHAEFKIGDSLIMISDEWPDMGIRGPKSRGGPTASMVLYVEDVDAAFKRAISAGASVDRPVQNEFWGDRMGTVLDPYGHKWSLATHVEDVPQDQLQQRMQAWAQSQSQAQGS